ncbi:MAG: METTL5 family protein [Candidatus Woesearchaeota archaeon]
MTTLQKITKAKLAIILSKLKNFETPKINLEQYTTDSEIASGILWFAYMKGDIKEKTVADLGCGTGILGIGALFLGAKKVFFLDSDKVAIDICKKNAKKFFQRAVFLCKDIRDFSEKVDTIIQNPPFGTKKKHSDKEFLKKAFDSAKVIYSFHKIETKDFVKKFSEHNGFSITEIIEYEMPLKATYKFHKKKIKKIKVGCFRLERTNTN